MMKHCFISTLTLHVGLLKQQARHHEGNLVTRTYRFIAYCNYQMFLPYAGWLHKQVVHVVLCETVLKQRLDLLLQCASG